VFFYHEISMFFLAHRTCACLSLTARRPLTFAFHFGRIWRRLGRGNYILRPWLVYIYMIWYDMIFYDILIYWGFATASPLRSALIRRDPDAWANSLAATSLACLLSIWPRPCHFLGRHTRTVCISSGTWRWFQNRSVYVKSFGKWRGDTAGPLVQL
jgi:hypothetical protein